AQGVLSFCPAKSTSCAALFIRIVSPNIEFVSGRLRIMRSQVPSTLIILTILLGVSTTTAGQRTGSGGGTSPVKAAEPTQTTTAPVRVITKYVPKPVTPTTGRLFVSAEPGAVILLEPLNIKRTEAQKGTVPEGRRDFVFNDLKPGNYRVAATLEGYHEVEKSPV